MHLCLGDFFSEAKHKDNSGFWILWALKTWDCPPIRWTNLLFICSDVLGSASCFVDLQTSLGRIWQHAKNGVRKPQHTPAHTCTAELDYLNNTKVCSDNAIGQWQMRSSIREGRKTANNSLWAVIDRCPEISSEIKPTGGGGLGHHSLVAQQGWNSTN